MRRLLERIRAWWKLYQTLRRPCWECRAAPVFIVFLDDALCSECYLQAMKDWLRKRKEQRPDGC